MRDNAVRVSRQVPVPPPTDEIPGPYDNTFNRGSTHPIAFDLRPAGPPGPRSGPGPVPGVDNAACSGFYDHNRTQPLQVVDRLGLIGREPGLYRASDW